MRSTVVSWFPPSALSPAICDEEGEFLPHDYQSLYDTVTGQSLKQCPVCLTGTMKLIERLASLASLLNSAPHSQLTLVAATQAIDSS